MTWTGVGLWNFNLDKVANMDSIIGYCICDQSSFMEADILNDFYIDIVLQRQHNLEFKLKDYVYFMFVKNIFNKFDI